MFKTSQRQKGFSLLPTVLVASVIIAEVGIALAFVMFMANSASYGARLLQEAYTCAKSGVSDALIRIIRNKDFYSSGYNLAMDRCVANIIVEKNVPKQDASQITVTGTVLNRQKKLQAIVSVDPDSGEVVLISLQEI